MDRLMDAYSETKILPKSETGSCLNVRLFNDAVRIVEISQYKGKGKVVPVLFLTGHHAMEAYWRSGGVAPRIL